MLMFYYFPPSIMESTATTKLVADIITLHFSGTNDQVENFEQVLKAHNLKRDELQQICRSLNLCDKGTAKRMINKILQYVKSEPTTTIVSSKVCCI